MYLIHAPGWVHALGRPTKVTDDDSNPDQDRCRAGHCAPDLGEQAGPAPARPARHGWPDRGGALRDPARRAVRAGGAPGHDPGRAGRPREGPAALDDPRHRRARGAQPGAPLTAPDRPAPGYPHRHRGGARGRPAGPAAQGRVAGPAAGRADRLRTRHAPGGRADPGEAQPVLLIPAGPPAPPGPAVASAASWPARCTGGARSRPAGCGPGAGGPPSTAGPGSRRALPPAR